MLNASEKALFAEKAKKGVCSHAYVVDGAAGVGKYDFALFCAGTLLCEGADKPCGFCRSCMKIALGNHPDVVTVGGEKAASIADVRELIRRSTLKPNDGDRQVFIIRSADKLRADAQNALLKLFEEPPESVTLFLLTESRSSLLPTVLSRGQRIHLDGMTDDEIREILREEFPASKRADADSAVAEAQGNIGVARKALSPESAAAKKAAAEILELALGKKRYELMLKLVIPKYKREQLTDVLRELIAMCVAAAERKYGFAPAYSGTAGQNGSKRALARIGECAAMCVESLESNANVTAAATKLSSDLCAAAS